MGTPTGRKNKSTSAPHTQQPAASQQPSSLTILSEPGGKWSWIIELDGKAYQSGIPPATGPARFSDHRAAAAFANANYDAACWMRNDQRRLEMTKRSKQPSPG